MQKNFPIIFLLGPTASGKSDTAIALAKKLNGIVINADSRHVYLGLDSGSGKITKQEQKTVPHFLIDVASPLRDFSAGKWLKEVRRIISRCQKNSTPIIVSGGTLFYIRALLAGWDFPNVKPDYAFRKKLEKLSREALYQKIQKYDPNRAQNLDPHNKKRLIRALEIIDSLGKVPATGGIPLKNALVFSLDIPIVKLEKRIHLRLHKRVPAILREIKQLRKKVSAKRLIAFGLEYEWFTKYNEKIISKQEAIENCERNIIRFAKRQIREIKKIPDVTFIKNSKQTLSILRTKKIK